jgi:translation initiation factor IF-2
LRIGDELVLNGQNIGKVRALYNYLGEIVKEAGPSTPTQIIGLKTLPEVGDIIQVGKGERIKHKKYTSSIKTSSFSSQEESDEEEAKTKKINIIIKSDMLGSAEAIEESLEKLNTSLIKVKIINKGLGNITDGDIKRAEASNAKILGFNVKIAPQIEEIAREKNIAIKLYNIIYNLINDIKKDIEALTVPIIKKIDLGKAKVIAIFRTEKNYQIVGCKVMSGRIESNSKINIYRNDELVGQAVLERLQSGKENVTTIQEGQECGLQCKVNTPIQNGDMLEIFKEEEKK